MHHTRLLPNSYSLIVPRCKAAVARAGTCLPVVNPVTEKGVWKRVGCPFLGSVRWAVDLSAARDMYFPMFSRVL